MEAFVCCQKRLLAPQLAFAAVAAFMLSSIQGTLLHPPPSWWVLPMQGTLPQLLLMLNGQ